MLLESLSKLNMNRYWEAHHLMSRQQQGQRWMQRLTSTMHLGRWYLVWCRKSANDIPEPSHGHWIGWRMNWCDDRVISKMLFLLV
ncbi:hypothetical protein BCR42DRAFT_425152 [Absidia repens]|uniref:Uncharacterized protein n=1 Tax=Absidia repens TaxID=90262 RepID=A0A1X2I3G1_9FUNG|nr:hypothetical protein BCR42DRAFT_425152 [Absidia repens]